MKHCHFVTTLGLCAGLLAGCAGEADAPADEALDPDQLPAGLTCAKVLAIGEEHPTLAAALAAATAGDCVRVDADASVNLDLPAGVQLVARAGAAALTLRPADPTLPVVTMRAGAGLVGLSIAGGSVGVYVDGGPAMLTDVSVQDVAGTALYAFCEGARCRTDDALLTLRAVTLRQSELGLWAHGANVRMVGGAVLDCDSTSLVGGYGAVASHGARLSLEGTELAGNEEVGLLVDGEGGTSAALIDAVVRDNLGRGVWAQGLRGTIEEPALSVTGGEGRIEGNRLVGLGSLDSRGIIVLDGYVGRTIGVDVLTDLGTTETIGDGIGLFGGTGTVRLERTELGGSTRAQLLVDQGAAGIIVLDGRVNPLAGQLGVIVQNTSAAGEPTGVDFETPRAALPVVDGALGLGPNP